MGQGGQEENSELFPGIRPGRCPYILHDFFLKKTSAHTGDRGSVASSWVTKNSRRKAAHGGISQPTAGTFDIAIWKNKMLLTRLELHEQIPFPEARSSSMSCPSGHGPWVNSWNKNEDELICSKTILFLDQTPKGDNIIFLSVSALLQY